MSAERFILEWPSVLVIALIKTDSETSEDFYQSGIVCPETLEFKALLPFSVLSQFSDSAPTYSLTAVVDRIGSSLDIVRYIAKAKNEDGQWLQFDTGDVAPLATPVTSSAYLLFYTKAPPPSHAMSPDQAPRQDTSQPELQEWHRQIHVRGIPANVCSKFISLLSYSLLCQGSFTWFSPNLFFLSHSFLSHVNSPLVPSP